MGRWTVLFVFLAASAAAQDVIPDLNALRADYPTPMSKAQLSDLMNRVALRHPGWGMLRKDGGNVCPTAYPGITISCDWMVQGPTRWGYDLIIDAWQEGGGRAEIVRGSDGAALAAGDSIIYPWMSGTPEPPAPSPPPPAPSPQPSPAPLPAMIDWTPLRQVLYDQAERIFAADAGRFDRVEQQQRELAAQLQRHDEQPSWLTRFVTSPAGAAILAGVTTWLTTWQVTKN